MKGMSEAVASEMDSKTPTTIYLNDYRSPAYLVESVELKFELYDSATLVCSQMKMVLNPDRQQVSEPLVLSGEQLRLLEVKLEKRGQIYLL